ncbi:unnamed protein product [Allacma fusca]|uniref:Uncharacterized protein n=1 Tax=Allacma fusca TaxID=39272 RepID=A0A8J2K832_9HEXA|nr:unnamed protein product [Allacma fusca]
MQRVSNTGTAKMYTKQDIEIASHLEGDGRGLNLCLNHNKHGPGLLRSSTKFLNRMKPAVWYMSMLFVAFLYFYVIAVQYIRGS